MISDSSDSVFECIKVVSAKNLSILESAEPGFEHSSVNRVYRIVLQVCKRKCLIDEEENG